MYNQRNEEPNLDQLISETFTDVCIDKALARQVGVGERSLPAFVSDWLVSRYADNSIVDMSKVRLFLANHLPDKLQKNSLLNELVKGRQLKILDSYSVRVDVKTGQRILQIPCLDIFDANIQVEIVDDHPLLLMGNVWGSGTLVRRVNPNYPSTGEVWMEDFKPMQTSIVDLDYYIGQRRQYTLRQWRQLLIRSMGYNPEAYSVDQQQLLLARLVAFVQPRVNLIELAHKGTGKSFVFSQLSRHSWLVSGGVVTRAQLFYDMRTRVAGVITRYDVVVLDEVQTIRLTNAEEIIGALKGYLEYGEFRVMQYKGTSESGFVLLANIPVGADMRPIHQDYFQMLPSWLQGQGATALLDRFHGLLPGWNLLRITKRTLARGMALKADYFSEILNALRNRTEYMGYVKENTYSDGDIRDIVAVERLSAAFLKLLFPDLSIVTPELFEEHCLIPAKHLRTQIRQQLAVLDKEYKPNLADIRLSN
jgi:ATP-dependent Lon protease